MQRRNNSASEGNVTANLEDRENKISKLNNMLGSVMKYISDEEIVEIDIEYLLDSTEGLRIWWDEYREKNRKRVEAEIKNSLSDLPLEQLEKIREQIVKKTEKKGE